jgi:hypothetical protein
MSEPEMDAPTTLGRADAPPGIELEGAPVRRTTPWARLARLALVALICLAAGGVLLREIGLARLQATTVAPGPAGPVVLLSNVSYGTVTVNGRRLAGAPPLALPLADGWNRLVFAAAPFTAQGCRVQWSAQGWVNGDCLATGPQYASSIVINGLVVHPALVIVFRLKGSDLPPLVYADARAVMARQLSAVSGYTSPVPAGELIAAGGHWPDAIASRPAGPGMQATMTFGLYNDGSGEPRTVTCDVALCAGGLFFTTASASLAPVWNVTPDAYYVWRFADGSGAQVESLPYPVSPALTMSLTYEATFSWQPLPTRVAAGAPMPVEILLGGTFCDAGIYALNALTQSRGYVPTPISTVVSNNGPEGCVMVLRQVGNQDLGKIIWRWGVLLAADLDAHIQLPDLPIASASEIAALGG